MGKKKNKKSKIDPNQFAEVLEGNEECMGEMAAMSVTCEQFGIDEEDGYELLMQASEG